MNNQGYCSLCVAHMFHYCHSHNSPAVGVLVAVSLWQEEVGFDHRSCSCDKSCRQTRNRCEISSPQETWCVYVHHVLEVWQLCRYGSVSEPQGNSIAQNVV